MPGGKTISAAARSALLLAVLGNAGEALAREPMLVVLRATAPSGRTFVRLSEIADIPNDPSHLREFAGGILLGFSPGPGVLREIEAKTVEARLRESGIPAGSFTVKGAVKTTVFSYQDPEPSSGDPGGVIGKGRAGVISAGGGIGRNGPAGRFLPFSVRAGAGGSPVYQPASFRRDGPPHRGEKAPAADAGVDLHRRVEKGDRVVIRREGKASILEEPGKAQESARRGQILEVLNGRTGKKIMARVIGDGIVEPLGAPIWGEKENR